MAGIAVGQNAPSFRLPAGHGGEVGSEDYLGRSNLIVWFAKGMGCPFCRALMSQLARGDPRRKQAGAEVPQVTPTKPERALVRAGLVREDVVLLEAASVLVGRDRQPEDEPCREGDDV